MPPRQLQGRFYNPVKSIFGWGSLDKIEEVIAGRKVLLLTFPEAEVVGAYKRLQSLVQPGVIKPKWTIGVPELPDINECRGLYRKVRNMVMHRENVVVLAVGGGSVLDVGKVVSLAASGLDFPEILSSVLKGMPVNNLPHLPLIAVPTTAGTGAEVTQWGTVWDYANKKKCSFKGKSLWPETAIVDPSLIKSCPDDLMRSCALDALSHSLEAIWNHNNNPVSDALAVSAARGIFRSLPSLLNPPSPPDAAARHLHLINLSYSSSKAGLAFSNTETALAHALSYPLTMEKGIKHGLAASFSLPRVLARALGKDQARDEVIHAVFDSLVKPGQDPVNYLECWLKEIGLSLDCTKYGFQDDEEVEKRLYEVSETPKGRNFIGVPRGLSLGHSLSPPERPWGAWNEGSLAAP